MLRSTLEALPGLQCGLGERGLLPGQGQEGTFVLEATGGRDHHRQSQGGWQGNTLWHSCKFMSQLNDLQKNS